MSGYNLPQLEVKKVRESGFVLGHFSVPTAMATGNFLALEHFLGLDLCCVEPQNYLPNRGYQKEFAFKLQRRKSRVFSKTTDSRC
jgi:hypothetical protein